MVKKFYIFSCAALVACLCLFSQDAGANRDEGLIVFEGTTGPSAQVGPRAATRIGVVGRRGSALKRMAQHTQQDYLPKQIGNEWTYGRKRKKPNRIKAKKAKKKRDHLTDHNWQLEIEGVTQ